MVDYATYVVELSVKKRLDPFPSPVSSLRPLISLTCREVFVGKTSPLQEAIETVESLAPEDQETLVEIIRLRLSEGRRAEIARAATETLREVREGRASYGFVEDLKKDLLAEP